MNCPTGKVEHQTVTAAQAHADSICRKDGHQPNVYVCSQCGFFHVGGGRASDRPAYRPAPIVATPRPSFVQKKIDKGKQVSVGDLVLEKLRTTLMTDEAIGRLFSIDKRNVAQIRKQNNISLGRDRANNAVRQLLVADPKRSRSEIARTLGVSRDRVQQVVETLGFNDFSCLSRQKGPKNPTFGNTKLRGRPKTPEARKLMSIRMKERLSDPAEREKLRLARLRSVTPEMRKLQSEKNKKFWNSPAGLALRQRYSLRKKTELLCAADSVVGRKLTSSESSHFIRSQY